MVSQPLHCLAKAAIRDLAKLSVAWRVSQPQKQHAKLRRIGSSIELLFQGFDLHPRLTQNSVAFFRYSQAKFSFLGEVWLSAGQRQDRYPRIGVCLQLRLPTFTTRYRRYHAIVLAPSVLSFMDHALAHINYILQLQLKASLSLHCVPNGGHPFLVEMIVMKTARHQGRCMMNHFAKR